MRITIALILLALSAFSHAEYTFDEFYFGVGFYDDDETLLGESEGSEFELFKTINPKKLNDEKQAVEGQEKNLWQNTFVRVDLKSKYYSEIFPEIDLSTSSVSIGKFIEEKREDGKRGAKAYAYAGFEVARVDIGAFAGSESDTGFTYGGGILVPRGNKLDLLLGLDGHSLYDQTYQNTFVGLNFNLSNRVSFRPTYVSTDQASGMSIGVRIKLENKKEELAD